uniref:Succinate:cytochrome c oxidoreductase subunit 3 n=1 Tax=Gelidiella acerosa TaxID=28867 RepID=A0A7G9IVP4_9FLOR|nr:succinate:cytochrome c oxidoreductase subunit 3 [Gelidiella acerosa]QNM39438.1 succinate:cytochrome c oxidoreductase subunit 3 [Gelidiella acerosa]
MFRDFSSLNRPLSPHLTIYLPQHSSLFSIWHRFSGVLLMFLVLIFLLSTNLVSFCGTQYFFYFVSALLSIWIKKLVFLSICLTSIYHFTNGIRHLAWDLGFWLHKDYFVHFAIVMILIFLLILIII